MIEFKNVSLKYINSFYSLLEFSLKIESNSFLIDNYSYGGYAILRTLSKIDKNYSGEILIDNKNIKDIPDKRLNLAYITENSTFFKFKSIEKNLMYPLKIRKFSKIQAREMVQNSIDLYLKDVRDYKIKDLNISQKKILSLIRGTLWKPKILLLENFFEEFDNTYLPIVEKILLSLSKNCLIVALEKTKLDFKIFENYNFFNL